MANKNQELRDVVERINTVAADLETAVADGKGAVKLETDLVDRLSKLQNNLSGGNNQDLPTILEKINATMSDLREVVTNRDERAQNLKASLAKYLSELGGLLAASQDQHLAELEKLLPKITGKASDLRGAAATNAQTADLKADLASSLSKFEILLQPDEIHQLERGLKEVVPVAARLEGPVAALEAKEAEVQGRIRAKQTVTAADAAELERLRAVVAPLRADLAPLLKKVDELLVKYFDGVCGPVKRRRANFLYAERELRTLFRLIDLGAIREEADDDIYVSQIGRAFKRAAEQYKKAKKVQDPAMEAAVRGLALGNPDGLQAKMDGILRLAGPDAAEKYPSVSSYLSCAKTTSKRLGRLVPLLEGSDTYDELRVALLPARRRTERQRASPVIANFWVIVGTGAVVAAFVWKNHAEDRYGNPSYWWWLGGLAAAAVIAGYAIRQFFDWNYVRDVRKALHEVLFGLEPKGLDEESRKQLERPPQISKGGRDIRRAAVAEETQGFYDSPGYYWVGDPGIASNVDENLLDQNTGQSPVSKKIIWNASGLWYYAVRGWVRWRPLQGAWKVIYDNTLPVLPAAIMAILLLGLSGCGRPGETAVTVSAGGRTYVIGMDGDGGDCWLAHGTLIQRSDEGVYIRADSDDGKAIGPDGAKDANEPKDSKAAKDENGAKDAGKKRAIYIIPERQVRRIEIDGSPRSDLPQCGMPRPKPPSTFAIPIFAARVETAPKPDGGSPENVFNKVSATTLNFDPDPKSEPGKESASSYVRAFARVVGACASPADPVVIDVRGFASDELMRNAENSPVSNHALAEGRRAAVLELMSIELKGKDQWIEIAMDDDGAMRVPLSTFQTRRPLDCFDATCLANNPWIRFKTSVEMRRARSAFPDVAEPGRNAVNEAFPRAVYITVRKGCGVGLPNRRS